MYETKKALVERTKELGCIYNISRVIEEYGDDIQKVLKTVVDILPGSWQYPDAACARIRARGKAYGTKSFKETNWRQSQDIVVTDEVVGEIEVFYREKKPTSSEGPFLKEERDLIDEIALRLGWYLRHRLALAQVEESERRYRGLLENIPDSVMICVRGNIRYANRSALEMLGASSMDTLQDSSIYSFVHIDALEDYYASESKILSGAQNKVQFEGKIINSAGKVVESDLTLVSSKLHNEPALQIIIRDIEHRKDIEYSALVETLTRRERQIMRLVADGETNKAIALHLGIREKTVEIHRANMMRKLSANSLADVIRISRSIS